MQQVLPHQDLERAIVLAVQLGDRATVDEVALPLLAFDRGDVRRQRVDVAKVRDRPQDRSARAAQHAHQRPERRKDLLDREQLHELRHPLLEVDDVVQSRREPQDVVSVQGHHERLIQGRDDLVGEVIAAMLEVADLLGADGDGRNLVDEGDELARGIDDVAGGCFEQVVEDQLAGDHLERHAAALSRSSPGEDTDAEGWAQRPKGGQPTNLYPSPRTVSRCSGSCGSRSIFWRTRFTCTSSVLVSPT